MDDGRESAWTTQGFFNRLGNYRRNKRRARCGKGSDQGLLAHLLSQESCDRRSDQSVVWAIEHRCNLSGTKSICAQPLCRKRRNLYDIRGAAERGVGATFTTTDRRTAVSRPYPSADMTEERVSLTQLRSPKFCNVIQSNLTTYGEQRYIHRQPYAVEYDQQPHLESERN